MPEGDVSVYYSLIPTESSIRKSAERMTKEFSESFESVLGDFSKKSGSFLKKLPGIEGFAKTPFAEVVRSSMAGFQGARAAGAGIGESAGAGMAAGGETAGALGGILPMLAGMAGGIAAMVGIMAAVAAAVAIVSAFFEAVGPILKTVNKILAAVILTALWPVLKALIPLIPLMTTFFLDAAKLFAGIVQGVIDAFANFFKGAGDFLAWLWDFLTGLIEGKIDIIEFFAKFIEGIFKFDVWLAENIAKLIVGIWDFAVWLGTAIWSFFADTVFPFAKWLGENILTFFDKVVFPFAKWIGERILDFFSKDLFNFAKWLGEGIWNFFSKDVFNFADWLSKNIGRFMGDKVFEFMNPGSRKVTGGYITPVKKEAGGLFGTGIGPTWPDFISRPGAGVAAFSPDDTIIGVKDPSKLGGRVSVVNNISIEAGVDAGKLKQILAEFSRQQARDLRQRVSYSGGNFA